jgi:hypothetical protein
MMLAKAYNTDCLSIPNIIMSLPKTPYLLRLQKITLFLLGYNYANQ